MDILKKERLKMMTRERERTGSLKEAEGLDQSI